MKSLASESNENETPRTGRGAAEGSPAAAAADPEAGTSGRSPEAEAVREGHSLPEEAVAAAVEAALAAASAAVEARFRIARWTSDSAVDTVPAAAGAAGVLLEEAGDYHWPPSCEDRPRGCCPCARGPDGRQAWAQGPGAGRRSAKVLPGERWRGGAKARVASGRGEGGPWQGSRRQWTTTQAEEDESTVQRP